MELLTQEVLLTDNQVKAAKAALGGSVLAFNTKESMLDELNYSSQLAEEPCTFYFREWEMLTEACSLRLTKKGIKGREDLEDLYELIKNIKVGK